MDEVDILSKMATRWWMGVDFAIWNLDVLLSIGQNEIWLKLIYEYIQIYRFFNAPLCIYASICILIEFNKWILTCRFTVGIFCFNDDALEWLMVSDRILSA